MFLLVYIIDPANKLYYIEPNHFSSNKKDAHQFSTREEAMEIQSSYPFNIDIEPYSE